MLILIDYNCRELTAKWFCQMLCFCVWHARFLTHMVNVCPYLWLNDQHKKGIKFHYTSSLSLFCHAVPKAINLTHRNMFIFSRLFSRSILVSLFSFHSLQFVVALCVRVCEFIMSRCRAHVLKVVFPNVRSRFWTKPTLFTMINAHNRLDAKRIQYYVLWTVLK